MEEIWKDIEGYEGLYQISNLGRVKSLGRYINKLSGNIWTDEKIKKSYTDRDGYYRVNLYKDSKIQTYMIHRLVALAFIPNTKDKPQVNHIDGNKENNNVSNLEWCTSKENNIHALKNKLRIMPRGNKNKLSKEIIQYDLNMKKIAKYGSIREAQRITGINQSNISKCCREKGNYNTAGGYIWKYKE